MPTAHFQLFLSCDCFYRRSIQTCKRASEHIMLKEEAGSSVRMSKLSFYKQYKQNHKLENYIVLVDNRRHRSVPAKLRCSAHGLKIEIGRYSRFYSEETKRHEQLPREKRTCDTSKDKVEDEHHFLLECSLNEEIRKTFSKNFTQL